MLREYHKWHSRNLDRDMELLSFGHAGARVIVFPTSTGRFFDWENRGMINALQQHLDSGWIQLYCVDSVDAESWYNEHADPNSRAARHLQFHNYVVNEVLPFSQAKNDNAYVIATGASFGAYHAINLAARFPQAFNRAIGMSGMYDIRRWTNGSSGPAIHESNPLEFIQSLTDGQQLERMKNVDWIIAVGKDDPSHENNQAFSEALWSKGIWHAFRVWDGCAHDWPYWQQMILHYIAGPDSKG